MTNKQKVAFINEFGEEAFVNLRLTHTQTAEVKTVADFARLPLAEKSRRITADPGCMAKLLPSPGVRLPGQAYINTAALDKIARTRPGYKAR
jgi:hypothetical protein